MSGCGNRTDLRVCMYCTMGVMSCSRAEVDTGARERLLRSICLGLICTVALLLLLKSISHYLYVFLSLVRRFLCSQSRIQHLSSGVRESSEREW